VPSELGYSFRVAWQMSDGMVFAKRIYDTGNCRRPADKKGDPPVRPRVRGLRLSQKRGE
jgi:hypothetical protein